MASHLARPGGRTRHRLWLLLAALPLAVGGMLAGPVPAAASAPSYYLALGDSLSQGVQPDQSGASVITDQGYVDDLFATESASQPGLQLAKLGCPGETTTTMIEGGICSYPDGSQLNQALDFLSTHDVAFITIDLGANNVDGCLSGSGIDQTCLENGFGAAESDLPLILGELREAAPGVPIFGMDYYDPFLAVWLSGPAGEVLATQSVAFADAFNSLLTTVYAAFGVPVAPVAHVFKTDSFKTFVPAGIPVNVYRVCKWTWMCAPAPMGPNIHANAKGYAVIAEAFAETIGP